MSYFFLFIFIGCLVSLDAFSKYITPLYFSSEREIIPGILSLVYVQNPGIAFSFPLTGLALKILTLILIFWIFWYYGTQERKKKSKILDISYALIIAGALGNAWERLFRSYVTDMISVSHFAVFNLADSSISLWACLLLYSYWKYS